MTPPTSKQLPFFWRLVIIALMAVAGFAAMMAWRYAPLREQGRNIAAARRHIPLLLAVLAKEARFASVELSTYTSFNGCLLVRGELDSAGDLEALKAIVQASHPPVVIEYMVMVITSEMKQFMKSRAASQLPLD